MITSPLSNKTASHPASQRGESQHGSGSRTDLSALKFNAVSVIFTTMFAVIFTLPLLTLALGSSMLVGALAPKHSPMKVLYRLFGPLLDLTPKVVDEDPRAHHFAQGVGGTFLIASALATLAGLPVLGAILGLAVIALAALNLSAKICVGCLMYYQYRRLQWALSARSKGQRV